MNVRKQILFILDKEIVYTETKDIDFVTILHTKTAISLELGCEVDEIEVKYKTIKNQMELSDLDVTATGELIYIKHSFPMQIQGLSIQVPYMSDEYLDACHNDTIQNEIFFSIKLG